MTLAKKAIQKHLHLYKKVNLARNPGVKDFWVMACQKPACSHYVRVDLAVNKLAECNRCHQPFVLTKHSITLTKPHCDDCIKHHTLPDVDLLANLVKDI